MHGVLVLAGPPAVGHNTVADLLALRLPPVAVVDGDDVRAMVRQPVSPGSGEDWDRQYRTSVQNVCSLAVNFDRAGYAVVVLDVVEPETVPLYRSLLASASRHSLVLLTADDDTLTARDRARDPAIEPDLSALAGWQHRIRTLRADLDAAADRYDHRIDTTHQTPEQTTDAVIALLPARGFEVDGAGR